jgi:hypothetical protein
MIDSIIKKINKILIKLKLNKNTLYVAFDEGFVSNLSVSFKKINSLSRPDSKSSHCETLLNRSMLLLSDKFFIE